jgi:hypothetical protein
MNRVVINNTESDTAIHSSKNIAVVSVLCLSNTKKDVTFPSNPANEMIPITTAQTRKLKNLQEYENLVSSLLSIVPMMFIFNTK